MSSTKKSVIYLDVEDDITAIIDKIHAADSSIVALVPPKRMPTLQSAVNLKLLKKASETTKKRVVIISSEASLLPLAGSVGVYVADTLKSRPYIPDAPEASGDEEIILTDETTVGEVEHAEVGILAGASAAATAKGKKEGDKDDADSKQAKASSTAKISDKTKDSLKGMKAKIPNFNKFRTRLIAGGILLVLLAIGWYYAFVLAPKANIVIHAQTTKVQIQTEFTLDETATSDDLENAVLVPVTETLKKTYSQTAPATGEKNVGSKASGIIEVRNCEYPGGLTIESGSVFTSESGFKFVATSDASITAPNPSAPISQCDVEDDGGRNTHWGYGNVNVVAAEPGTTYNLPHSSRYSHPAVIGNMIAIGSQMTGGTDEIVKIVSQQDVDDAAETLKKTEHDDVLTEIETKFPTSVTSIPTTFTVKEGKPKGEPAVGEEADEVVVTLAYDYTIKGVKTDSLEALLNKAVADEVGQTDLNIYDTGINQANFAIKDDVITVTTDAFIGPEFDLEAIKQEIAGQRFSAAKDLLNSKANVKAVDIDLSPFWVLSMPRADKIVIEVDVTENALR